MKSGAMVLVLATLLSGCGGNSGATTNANAAAAAPGATPDPMEAKIRALDPVRKRLTFFRAIYDADYTCQKIVSIVDKPRDEGRPVWLVTCDDQGEYRVTLVPGGTFTVSGVPQPKNTFPHVRASVTPQ